jgi:hypothetical protein
MVLLPGVGPALMARRNGVIGVTLSGVLCSSRSGERRCFLRADSAILSGSRNAQRAAKWDLLIDVRERVVTRDTPA